jgi:hypothetical protein
LLSGGIVGPAGERKASPDAPDAALLDASFITFATL